MKNFRGFTLMEVLIVTALLIIISGGSFLTLVNYRRNQDIRLTAKNLVLFIKNAQARAISQDEGTEWGIRFQNTSGAGIDSYHLFSGPSYISSWTQVRLPSSVEFSDPTDGLNEDVIFSKITGLPGSSAVVTIRLRSDNSVIRTININAQGTITEN